MSAATDTIVLIHELWMTPRPGRPHFPGAPGWEEVADYALTWARDNARARR